MTLDVPLRKFTKLIWKKHAVQRARKSVLYMRLLVPETYTAGDIDTVQVSIYNKRAELENAKPWKRQLTIDHSIGQDWWSSAKPITRVEVRIGRTALKEYGIDSVADLLKRERAIIDYITRYNFWLLERF